MKKLNITKEQFEKSRYFKNKYGKLEYVSESGKVFKTNKGKVLMFKESIKDFAPGIQDWGTTIYVEPLGAELDWETVFSYVKHDCRQFPLLEQEIGVKPYETPSNRQIRNWIKKNPESFIDYLKECGYYDHLSELTAADDDSYDESTKKFGKKFSESEGGVTCHATCVDWDAPKTKTFKTLAQCKRWMETTADEIASEWGSMVEGLAVWAEDDELIVISGNGKVVAKFKIVPDYEDFHDPDEYYQESGKKFVNEGTKMHDALFDFINALAEYCDGYQVKQAIQEISDPVMRKKFDDMWQEAMTDRII